MSKTHLKNLELQKSDAPVKNRSRASSNKRNKWLDWNKPSETRTFLKGELNVEQKIPGSVIRGFARATLITHITRGGSKRNARRRRLGATSINVHIESYDRITIEQWTRLSQYVIKRPRGSRKPERAGIYQYSCERQEENPGAEGVTGRNTLGMARQKAWSTYLSLAGISIPIKRHQLLWGVKQYFIYPSRCATLFFVSRIPFSTSSLGESLERKLELYLLSFFLFFFFIPVGYAQSLTLFSTERRPCDSSRGETGPGAAPALHGKATYIDRIRDCCAFQRTTFLLSHARVQPLSYHTCIFHGCRAQVRYYVVRCSSVLDCTGFKKYCREKQHFSIHRKPH